MCSIEMKPNLLFGSAVPRMHCLNSGLCYTSAGGASPNLRVEQK